MEFFFLFILFLELKTQILLETNEVKTGESVQISLNGAPKSMCSISAIDKSVTFMGKRDKIDFPLVSILYKILSRLITYK